MIALAFQTSRLYNSNKRVKDGVSLTRYLAYKSLIK